jgi:hypothetical protein
VQNLLRPRRDWRASRQGAGWVARPALRPNVHMTPATIHVVRLVGSGIHVLVALGAIALGIVTGIDVLVRDGMLTEVGGLFALAVSLNLAGAVAFQLCRNGVARKVILPIVECLILAATLQWLASDFAIFAALCVILALFLAVSWPKTDVPG